MDYPGKEFVEREIREVVGISKSGTNYALRELVKSNFIYMYKKGKIHLYSLNYKNPVKDAIEFVKEHIKLHAKIVGIEREESWKSRCHIQEV